MKKIALVLGSMLLSSVASAGAIGLSTHPFTMKKQVVTTEFNNYMTNGTGSGITAKYLQKVNENITFDAGFGISDGDRTNRVFMGTDFALIPDYGRQPRVSIKGLLGSQDFAGHRLNSFGAAPTISKGFAFWGKEAFPFLAVPLKVSLDTNENTYKTSSAIAAGITGRVPLAGYENLVYNFETNMSLRNSYTGFVMGISLPIQ